MKDDKVIIVWHRRDLRADDNKALYEASKITKTVLPVFVIDPFFFRKDKETCDDRIFFMFECLKDLDRQYQQIGSSLIVLFGNTLEQLGRLKDKYDASVYYNYDTNMPFGFERDFEASKKEGFCGFNNDAVIRDKKDTRTKWAEQCQEYFESKLLEANAPLLPHGEKSTITFEEVIEKYSLKKQKEDVPKGGSLEAMRRLNKFILNIDKYPSSISKPYLAELFTSRISAHLSFGCISTRQVYQKIAQSKVKPKARQFYLSRIYWNQYFTQKLEDFPRATSEPINPYFKNVKTIAKPNPYFIEAFKKGRTGFPLIDASVRALIKTGFANFRMRAMLASFFSLILKQDWKVGADWMHYHLIDADTAINYEQWQMQSGLVGVHPLRLYNPTKQIFDNDPEGKFIKKYVPELKGITTIEYLAEPWKFRDQIEKQANIRIGKDYPLPIVNFTEEMRAARAFYKEIGPEMRAYLGMPEIKQRASLSKRRTRTTKKKEKPKDSSLDKFMK